MLATQSLLQNLAVVVSLGPVMSVLATSVLSGSIVTQTPPPTISSEPPIGCMATGATIMMPRAEPVGELHTAMESASITYSLPPSVPCSVLAVLPSSLQDDFADFETRWYNWWQTQRCVPGFMLQAFSFWPCFIALPLFHFSVAYYSPWKRSSDEDRNNIEPTFPHGLRLARVSIQETLPISQANISTLPRAWIASHRRSQIVQILQGLGLGRRPRPQDQGKTEGDRSVYNT